MSAKRLRVLVLADSRSFHTERYVRQMRRQGCRVVLASFERGPVHHYHLPCRGFVRQLHYSLGATEIRRLARRVTPDVINPHFVSGYGFAATLARVRRYAPVLVHLWGSDILLVPTRSILHKKKAAYALRRADFICADSAYLLEAARAITSFSCPSEIIPWGIERAFLSLFGGDRSLQKPLRIIVPRSHEKVYDNLFVVRALAPLVVRDTVRLTFPRFGSLSEKFVKDAGAIVGNRLHFYERLPRSGFMGLMANHDVCLSNALSDSSPASIIEAMGLGLIPVAADTPGVREWLGSESGFRYEPGSPEGLLRVISRLIDSDDTLKGLRRNNLELVKKRGLFENNVAATIAVMRRLAGWGER